jgi:hypothetical protein
MEHNLLKYPNDLRLEKHVITAFKTVDELFQRNQLLCWHYNLKNMLIIIWNIGDPTFEFVFIRPA